MIPRIFLNQWKERVPWSTDRQVEQDMILSRALVEIFSTTEMGKKIAFKGGTALHKLHFSKPGRYSEDLDFVQLKAEPIGSTLDALRKVLDPWLGEPRRDLKEGLIRATYRITPEGAEGVMKLKVEINPREHFAANYITTLPFNMESNWFSGNSNVTTVTTEWLLAGKLRALYGRKKGRDLYDLWSSLVQGTIKGEDVVKNFLEHSGHIKHSVSRAEFEQNMFFKLEDPVFRGDLRPLLPPEGDRFEFNDAYSLVHREIISKLPGKAWKGTEKRGRVSAERKKTKRLEKKQ